MADKSPFLKNSSSHRIKTFQIFEEEIVKWIEQVLSVKIDKGLVKKKNNNNRIIIIFFKNKFIMKRIHLEMEFIYVI